jgi:hypothetical protein
MASIYRPTAKRARGPDGDLDDVEPTLNSSINSGGPSRTTSPSHSSHPSLPFKDEDLQSTSNSCNVETFFHSSSYESFDSYR